jgi:hypothetical protein
MQSITSITTASAEFELCKIHWKGTEFAFWCKVLSAKEHRRATDYFSKDGTLDLSKYREQADAFVSMCVYVPASDAPDSKRPTITFTDDDGEEHEVRQWLSKGEAGELKAALLDKIRTEVEKVNQLKPEQDLGKE